MGKKKTSRKLRRHPELLNAVLSSAAPSQINRQYAAAEEDLPELLAWKRNHPSRKVDIDKPDETQIDKSSRKMEEGGR